MSDSIVKHTIPLSEPEISGNEWKYIKECLDSGWVSSAGKYVELFENKIAEYTGSKYAIGCVNGTSALQVSLRLAGVQSGDEVLVPTLTFIAPVNAINYNGAEPVFMDADEYYNIDVDKTINFIHKFTKFENGYTINKSTNKRITAIIPVHVFGNAVDFSELIYLCEERNIAVVEDAAESMGTRYGKDKFTGKHTGTIGRLGCLSFNGNKIITAGGGGVILTNDSKLAEKARYLTTQANDDKLYYVHDEIGYNFRMTNINAAMGIAQLEKLPYFLEKKREIYNSYRKEIENIEGLEIADVPDYAQNNHWMTLLKIDKVSYGKDRDGLMAFLLEHNISTRPVWRLNHMQKPYRHCRTYKIEKASELVEESLCLPGSVDLTEYEMSTIIHCLEK